LVHIGVRWICAGIAALAIGFALESVGRRVVGAASAGLRAESALFSVFETIRPKSLDHRASLVRVASLETEFAFEPAVEESEPPASTSRHASFGERFLVAAMTVLIEPFAPVYYDRSRLGVIFARGRNRFEAYAADDHSLGLFPSPRKAAAAIATTQPWVVGALDLTVSNVVHPPSIHRQHLRSNPT
jgi:hypothetical protein